MGDFFLAVRAYVPEYLAWFERLRTDVAAAHSGVVDSMTAAYPNSVLEEAVARVVQRGELPQRWSELPRVVVQHIRAQQAGGDQTRVDCTACDGTGIVSVLDPASCKRYSEWMRLPAEVRPPVWQLSLATLGVRCGCPNGARWRSVAPYDPHVHTPATHERLCDQFDRWYRAAAETAASAHQFAPGPRS